MTQSDTSGEAFGALVDQLNATRAGANDPPLTLTGTQRHAVRGSLLRSYLLLEKLEGKAKEWRVREGIRKQRIELGAALAYVPEPVTPKPAPQPTAASENGGAEDT